MLKRINWHLLGLLAFLLILCLDNMAYRTATPIAEADSIAQRSAVTPSCLPTNSPLPTAAVVTLPTPNPTPSTLPLVASSATPELPVGPIIEDRGSPIFRDHAKTPVLRPAPVKMISTDTVAAAQKMMQILLGPTEYACFDRIIWTESHWNPTAVNAKNGACGLGQASPCSKMENAIPDWPIAPSKQVKWFLSYINRRYGDSCKAWAFWSKNGWY